MTSIPKDAATHNGESWCAPESVMHGAIGKDVPIDPPVQDGVLCMTPCPLSCVFIGCTVFTTTDQPSLRVTSASRDDGNFWMGLFVGPALCCGGEGRRREEQGHRRRVRDRTAVRRDTDADGMIAMRLEVDDHGGGRHP